MNNEHESQLSDEFKKDIKEKRKNNNFLGIIVAVLATILVFGTVGVASYQMFFKNDNSESKSASDKIESRPTEKTETKTNNSETVTTNKTTTEDTSTTTTKEYTVVDGDVLGTIATKFNTTVAKLKELNSITDENSLQIGQVIKVAN